LIYSSQLQCQCKLALKLLFIPSSNSYTIRWFRHSQYSSFQRQLNIYGFTRILQGIDKNAYYHEHFIKGDYHRTLRIQRQAIKGMDAAVRNLPDHKKVPNFYRSTASRAPEKLTRGTVRGDARLPVVSMPSSASMILDMLHLYRQNKAQKVPQTEPLLGVNCGPIVGLGNSIVPWSTPYSVSSGWLGCSDSALGTSSLLDWDLAHRLSQDVPHALWSDEMAWKAQALLDALRRRSYRYSAKTTNGLPYFLEDREVALRSLLWAGADHGNWENAVHPMLRGLLQYSSSNSSSKFGGKHHGQRDADIGEMTVREI
jgi:HSF-type DNA-binding